MVDIGSGANRHVEPLPPLPLPFAAQCQDDDVHGCCRLPASIASSSTASYDPCLVSETRPRAVWTLGVPILAIFHRVQPPAGAGAATCVAATRSA